MTDKQIKYMVERFLSWKLPDNFNPDDGISFKKTFNEHTTHPAKHEPVGTNLFDFTQATEMVCHMVEGMPETYSQSELDALIQVANEAALRKLQPTIEKLREDAHQMKSPFWIQEPIEPDWPYVAKAFEEIATQLESLIPQPSALARHDAELRAEFQDEIQALNERIVQMKAESNA